MTGVEAGALVEYSTNGGSTWSSSFTAVEGLDNVQVRETDVAGNHSTATSFLFTLDTSADKNTPATLVTNGTIDDVINNTEKTAVAYTVAGLDADATAVITFASTGGGTKTANVSANGTFSVDLTTLGDGTITESMLITDTAGNTKTVTGTPVSGTTLKLTPAPTYHRLRRLL